MFPINPTKQIFQNLFKPQTLNTKSQQLWTWVAISFNKVDYFRLKLVGPDRMCAEWVLKNGGAVAFVQPAGKFFHDYNLLPPESTHFKIQAIDATNSSIMKIGMEHLKNCKYIDTVILHSCKHLEGDGLPGLAHIKESLRHLQISSCYNFDDESLLDLKELTKLKSLLMFDLPFVKDLDKIVRDLKPYLRECTISTRPET